MFLLLSLLFLSWHFFQYCCCAFTFIKFLVALFSSLSLDMFTGSLGIGRKEQNIPLAKDYVRKDTKREERVEGKETKYLHYEPKDSFPRRYELNRAGNTFIFPTAVGVRLALLGSMFARYVPLASKKSPVSYHSLICGQ